MKPHFDHLLIAGFGAPSYAEDVPEYLKGFSSRVTPERIQTVLAHYEQIGGGSPYGPEVFRFRQDLEALLHETGVRIPVFVGMRHWRPRMQMVMQSIFERRLQRGLCLVLSAYRSERSYGVYEKLVTQTQTKFATRLNTYTFLKPWYQEKLYIAAVQARVATVLGELKHSSQAKVLFVAHSIPKDHDWQTYAEQLELSVKQVMTAFKGASAQLVYQSAGSGSTEWLGPDIADVLKQPNGVKTVVVVPLGFLCENAEIRYDLDIVARQTAERAGILFFRVPTVLGHPDVLRMFCERIQIACKNGGTDA